MMMKFKPTPCNFCAQKLREGEEKKEKKKALGAK